MHKDRQPKPNVFLLVGLALLIVGGFIAPELVTVYANMKGIARSAVPSLNARLIAMPALCLWMPISFLLGNLVVYVLPPLRHRAGLFGELWRPSFWAFQRMLLKLVGVFGLICIPLVIFGFLL